jgi:CRISPR-associated protein Cmr3
MWLFIEPSDVLFFRTSRPFNAGESGYLMSLFPPTPETVQGALRARIAANWDSVLSRAFALPEVQTLIGNQDSYGKFEIQAYMLGHRVKEGVELLFPPPAHLARCKESHAIYRVAPVPRDDALLTNLPDGLRLLEPEQGYPTGEELEEFTEWLTLADLCLALSPSRDGLQKIKGISARKLFTFEPRLGIGMVNASKTTQEGLLYQANFVRIKKDVGLVVHVELDGVEPQDVQSTLKLPDKGWLALGGERRAASVEVLKAPPTDAALEPASGPRACLYFVTPAYLDLGWRPADWHALVGAAPVAAAVSAAVDWRLAARPSKLWGRDQGVEPLCTGRQRLFLRGRHERGWPHHQRWQQDWLRPGLQRSMVACLMQSPPSISMWKPPCMWVLVVALALLICPSSANGPPNIP